MQRDRIEELLIKFRSVRVAVIGDFCIDAYWVLDPSRSVVSVESGRATVPVREQTYGLGGAGNIVQNLAALGAETLYALGVVGDDLFGRELTRLLERLYVDTSGVVIQKGAWATPVYGKPFYGQEELARLDFGMWNEINERTETELLQHMDRIIKQVQAVIINQQLQRNMYSERIVREINAFVGRHEETIFLVDSRDRSREFKKVIHRLNEKEAAAHCEEDMDAPKGISLRDVHRFAAGIHKETGKPVFISRGRRGGMVCWSRRIDNVPGIETGKEIDSVGAGDTAASTLAAALAAGANPLEAAELANLASAVTVQKIRTTGTASPEEILQLFERMGNQSSCRRDEG